MFPAPEAPGALPWRQDAFLGRVISFDWMRGGKGCLCRPRGRGGRLSCSLGWLFGLIDMWAVLFRLRLGRWRRGALCAWWARVIGWDSPDAWAASFLQPRRDGTLQLLSGIVSGRSKVIDKRGVWCGALPGPRGFPHS